MDSRRWLWIGACLLLAGAIFWGVGQAVGPSAGDVEFGKTLEALKQVKSFRSAYDSAGDTFHSERTLEVDCNRVVIHQQSRNSGSGGESAYEMKEEEFLVGEQRYTRDRDGSWQAGYAGPRTSAKWYCGGLTAPTGLLPDISTMIHHAITEKGDKKTVNGVPCRVWKFDLRTAVSSRLGSVCLGVDDHLPYEMTNEGGHYLYSDYNQPIELDVPQAVVQPASSPQEP
jgi:hypothetical protein